MNNDSEKNMKKLLQTIYKPAVASSEFRDGLLERLTSEVGGGARELTIPLWKSPRLWVLIASVIILAVIAYGIWLPQATVLSASLPPMP